MLCFKNYQNKLVFKVLFIKKNILNIFDLKIKVNLKKGKLTYSIKRAIKPIRKK